MIKEVLSAELFTSAFNLETCKDKKLSEIGLFIKGLLFAQDSAKTAQDE